MWAAHVMMVMGVPMRCARLVRVPNFPRRYARILGNALPHLATPKRAFASRVRLMEYATMEMPALPKMPVSSAFAKERRFSVMTEISAHQMHAMRSTVACSLTTPGFVMMEQIALWGIPAQKVNAWANRVSVRVQVALIVCLSMTATAAMGS